MSELKDDTPNPGSDEAVDAGCLCPVKKSGKYLRGIFNNHESNWINIDCPIHGAECTYCGKINCKGDQRAYQCGE